MSMAFASLDDGCSCGCHDRDLNWYPDGMPEMTEAQFIATARWIEKASKSAGERMRAKMESAILNALSGAP